MTRGFSSSHFSPQLVVCAKHPTGDSLQDAWARRARIASSESAGPGGLVQIVRDHLGDSTKTAVDVSGEIVVCDDVVGRPFGSQENAVSLSRSSRS